MDVINDITSTVTKPERWLKPVLIVGAIILGIWIIYRLYIHFAYKTDDTTINADIAAQSSDPNIQAIIKEGVNSILNSPALAQQAYTYSQASGIDYNSVVVTEAINSAKQHGYIQ